MSDSEARKRGRPRAYHEDADGKIVQSLDKAISVLTIVSSGSGMSLSEISRTADIPGPTVYRALITMQQHDLVDFDDTTQLWRIDVGAFRIGSSFLTNTSIAEQARPVMQELMAATGETANLGIIAGTEVVFLSQVETHHPIRAFFRPGTHGSIHASGIGKALFSFRSDQQARSLASSLDLATFTQNTLRTPEALLAMRKETLRRGYAVDDEERTLGMRCVAAPIFNSFREAVAAISVSGPTVRVPTVSVGDLGVRVRAAADKITRNVGGRR